MFCPVVLHKSLEQKSIVQHMTYPYRCPSLSWQSNDEEFSKQLAALCDYYVNDAFGTAHRAHASTEGITKFVDRTVSCQWGVSQQFCIVQLFMHYLSCVRFSQTG